MNNTTSGVPKRTLILVTAAAGALALAALTWFTREDTNTRGADLVLVDNGDVYLVPPGKPLDSELAVFSERGYYPIDMIVFEEGKQSSTTSATVDGRDLLLMHNKTEYKTVLLATVDGGEPEELMSGGLLDVAIDGDRLQVIDNTESGSRRCYRGAWKDIGDQSLFRGDHCQFSRSGHLAGFTYDDDAFGVQVFAPDGSLQLELQLEMFPIVLTDDGRILVSYDYAGAEVVLTSTTDGSELVRIKATDVVVKVVQVSHDVIAIGSINNNLEASITLVDGSGNPVVIAEGQPPIDARSDGEGRLYWKETNGSSATLFRWDQASDAVVELAEGDRLEFDLTERGVAAAIVDRGGVEVIHIDTNGAETSLWEYNDVSEVRLDTQGDRIAVVAIADGSWAGALLAADGAEPVVHEGSGEPGAHLLPQFRGDWLILGDPEPGHEGLIAINPNGTITELKVENSSGTTQIHGETLFVDVRADEGRVELYSGGDVLGFDLSSGAEIDDVDYHGVRLAPPAEEREDFSMYIR